MEEERANTFRIYDHVRYVHTAVVAEKLPPPPQRSLRWCQTEIADHLLARTLAYTLHCQLQESCRGLVVHDAATLERYSSDSDNIITIMKTAMRTTTTNVITECLLQTTNKLPCFPDSGRTDYDPMSLLRYPPLRRDPTLEPISSPACQPGLRATISAPSVLTHRRLCTLESKCDNKP